LAGAITTLDLSFAVHCSAVSAQVPSMTLGKVGIRTTSAWAACMNSPDTTMKLEVCILLSSFAVCLRWRRSEFSARLEEKTKQHASADNLRKRAESKERNQDQQHDDRRRDRLMKRAAADFGDLGERYKKEALIWPVLHRSFVFLALLIVLTVLEELIVGYLHNRAFAASFGKTYPKLRNLAQIKALIAAKPKGAKTMPCASRIAALR
jgi:hypothetical protein